MSLAHKTVALQRALHERDSETALHGGRTSALAVALGRECRLDTAELDLLSLAGGLHDVGKIGIPDRVLFKPGALDDEELALMRTHARRGHDILSTVPHECAAQVAQVALHHHEAWDGSGYPQGLAGEAIPLLARIVAIADAWDAMASERPYRPAMDRATILRAMTGELSSRYDPALLRLFTRVVASGST